MAGPERHGRGRTVLSTSVSEIWVVYPGGGGNQGLNTKEVLYSGQSFKKGENIHVRATKKWVFLRHNSIFFRPKTR